MGVGLADFLPFGQTDRLPELLGLGSSGDKSEGRGAEVTRVTYYPHLALFLAAASLPLLQTSYLICHMPRWYLGSLTALTSHNSITQIPKQLIQDRKKPSPNSQLV